MNIIEELREQHIEGEIVGDATAIAPFSQDYSLFRVEPQAVVEPKNIEDIKKLVRFATAKKQSGEHVSLTGRSAGTDMGGGPLNESIIVSFTQHFNHIQEMTEEYVVVEPGVYFRDLEKELTAKGLLYPAYPASKDLCALGGMVNNNSGGELTLKYGKTENYIEETQLVMADGELHTLKALDKSQLDAKMNEQTFEGELYRKLFKLLEDNEEIIAQAKPKVTKNSAGYYLWNVWNGAVFDINKLIVGAQGTLGLLAAAKLKVLKKKKYSRLIVIFSKSLDPIPDLVKALLPLHPDSIESYDDKTLALAMKFFPAMVKLMKGNLLKMAVNLLPEFWMIATGGVPKMILLVSVSADDPKELDALSEEIARAAQKFPDHVRIVKKEDEANEYWTVRRQSFNLLHSHVKGLYAAPFIDDIIVNPDVMPELLPQVNAILDQYKKELIYTIAGHPGNGNFHIIPLVNLKDETTRRIIPEVTEQVYQLVIKYGGSITAEHNDGIMRTPYLREMYGDKIIELFAEVKKIFDPLNIFNPGKKVGGTKEFAATHMRKA